MKKTFAQIIQESEESSLKKLLNKVPEWNVCNRIEIPKSLNVEQCSSSATASFKAQIAVEACGNSSNIADLTGGLGVDSWAFSKTFGHVLHNEMDTELSKAVESNFKALGIENCIFRNMKLEEGTLDTILCGFTPDILYLDPARRNADGKKVFLLKDCSPDITSLKDELFRHCGDILAKISPMADISLIAQELGEELKQIYICGAKGECKELLLHMRKGWDGGYGITCIDSGSRMDFESNQGDAPVRFLPTQGSINGRYLFEPGAVLMKSGCMGAVASSYGLAKAGRNTHLYFAEELIPDLRPFGKFFTIKEVMQFSAGMIRSFAQRKLQADVTAKAIPISSEELKKRLRTSTGGTEHIFASAMDFSEDKSDRIMILAAKVL